MLQLVIFDWDGTIADTLPLCMAAFRASIQPYLTHTLTDREIIDTFGPAEGGTIQALIPDHYEEGLAAYLTHYRALHGMCEKPFDGMDDVFSLLKEKGVHIALVTGKGKESADITLERFGLSALFEVVETGSPVRVQKMEGMQSVLQKLDIPASDAVYVGDTVSDIREARRAGLTALAAAWAETADIPALEAAHPDALFRTVADFAAYLRTQLATPVDAARN